MRVLLLDILIGLITASVSACASPVTVDGAPVYGKLGLVSTADVRAAIAADRSSPSQPSSKIYAVEVVSKTEIHIHHAPWNPHIWEYNPILKIGGEWRKSGSLCRSGCDRRRPFRVWLVV